MKPLQYPLILGSGSPRRKELLASLGWDFKVIVRETQEFFPENLHPRAVAVLIAENKAKVFDDLSQHNLIITADTIVVSNGTILGKPASQDEAVEMLKTLSDKTHLVITGVTVFHGGKFKSFSVETKVTFRELLAWEIAHYIETYQPFDKAGGYGIQEWIGKIGITTLEGDYYNVMGLPLARLYEELSPFIQ